MDSVIILCIWAFFAVLVGVFYGNTKVGIGGGILISLLTSPIIGLVILLLLPTKEAPKPQQLQLGTALEIEQLLQLKEKGALTEQEFQDQKIKLLNR